MKKIKCLFALTLAFTGSFMSCKNGSEMSKDINSKEEIICETTSNKTETSSSGRITFSSTDLNGVILTDEIFSKNKITMLNIWATFCWPCIEEMPDLAKLNDEYKEKSFEVVGIPFDIVDNKGNLINEKKENFDLIIQYTGANYKHIIPTLDMMNGMLKDIQAVPTTIFVDSTGKQIGEAYVGSRSLEEWHKIVDELLKN